MGATALFVSIFFFLFSVSMSFDSSSSSRHSHESENADYVSFVGLLFPMCICVVICILCICCASWMKRHRRRGYETDFANVNYYQHPPTNYSTPYLNHTQHYEGKKPVPILVPSSIPQNDNTNIENLTKCNICFDNVSDAVLLECGHSGVCVSCASQLSNCPYCRQSVVRIVKIFHV
eukprot:TRINITY_DN7354_c0_g1_i4.p1 TRINITY_DN7354_c0_g1~~TRINITY_DN7354_c0_g1_i4.p1  ORF type:complete len:177 (-),score=5.66 TRINITY_DN7354_c0_g1_i4:85-615(-)